MSLNLAQKVSRFLEENQEKKFTARDIAEWIFQTFPNECKEKQTRSKAAVNPLDNDDAVIQQLVAEIGAQRPRLQKKTPEIKTTEGRPRKYYYSHSSDSDEIEKAEKTATEVVNNISKTVSPAGEYTLYPKLAEYLLSELRIYSKRIDEKRASNTQGPKGNKWLYPDLVGMEDLSHDWDSEIKECVKVYSEQKTRLWSFEVKVLLNRSNIREAFFQVVSNSSWANYGYLVAGEITGDGTLKELQMLSNLHGIGVIRLDTENPVESQILIPANDNVEIDWDSANRIAKENKDFRDYIMLVRQFYQTGNIKRNDWIQPEKA